VLFQEFPEAFDYILYRLCTNFVWSSLSIQNYPWNILRDHPELHFYVLIISSDLFFLPYVMSLQMCRSTCRSR